MRRAFGRLIRKRRKGVRPYIEASYVVPEELAVKYPGTTKRVYKTFPLTERRRAAQWLDDEQRLIGAGTWAPPRVRRQQARAHELTFNQYWKGWLEHRTWRGRPLRPGTLYVTRKSIENNILPYLGDVRLRDVTQAMVDRWLGSLTVGPGARHNAYKALRAMLRTASQPGEHGEPPLIPAYPITRAEPKPAREGVTVPATPEQIRVIYRHMPERYRLAVYLSVYCGGLRMGEVCALQRRDIDLANLTLSVRRERLTQGGQLVGPPKTGGSRRTVDIPPQLGPLVRDFLDQHVAPEPAAWLFPAAGDPGTPVHPKTMRGLFARAREAAGRPDLRFHDLRHTGLTLLAGEGATVRELMDEAGHSTADMAMRYQHEVDGRRRMLADRMGRLILPVDASDLDARIEDLDRRIKQLKEERDRLVRMRDERDPGAGASRTGGRT